MYFVQYIICWLLDVGLLCRQCLCYLQQPSVTFFNTIELNWSFMYFFITDKIQKCIYLKNLFLTSQLEKKKWTSLVAEFEVNIICGERQSCSLFISNWHNSSSVNPLWIPITNIILWVLLIYLHYLLLMVTKFTIASFCIWIEVNIHWLQNQNFFESYQTIPT